MKEKERSFAFAGLLFLRPKRTFVLSLNLFTKKGGRDDDDICLSISFSLDHSVVADAAESFPRKDCLPN